MSYYKVVEGKKLDSHLLQLAEMAANHTSGTISSLDAEKIFAAVSDGGTFTEVERNTVDYILKKFRWAESARDWFNGSIAALHSKHLPPQIVSLEEIQSLHFIKTDVLETPAERQARLHDLRSATAETYQDHDEIGIILRLENGSRVKLFSNFIELEGDHVELRGGKTIPLKAIEKVEV